MKNIRCILFFLIAIFLSPHTSGVFSFPSTNANWVYQYFNEFQQPGPFTSYTINGDTVIANRNYKRISGCAYLFGICNSGCIRDSNNVVYFIPDTCSTEYVLYDFNLNIGDTLFHPYDENLTGHNFIIVWDVDFVTASDGIHRRFLLSSQTVWIEGIGSESYLFMPSWESFGLSGNDRLQCMATDSGDWYGSSSCIASIYNPIDLKNSVLIYPNPFSSSAKLEFKCLIQNGELILFNSFGEMVRKEYISSTTSYLLERKSLLNGFYFLQLKSETGILQKKIMIEKASK